MGKGKQTIGYHYMFDILFGLGRGPINDLRAIKVADNIAFDGPLCATDVQAIAKPDLFGGEKKEGGIQGPFRVFFGGKDQVLPGAGSAYCGSKGPMKGNQTLPDVKTAIGNSTDPASLVSDMRGTTMVWFSGLVTSMNPYPKEWSFRVRRYSAGWYNNSCWYPAKSVIFMADGKVHAMNPAHIIFQCFTDPSWGRGLPWEMLDDNAFTYAANTLCSEGFGLCFTWQRKGQELDSFMDTVCEHIGAVRYTDPETGKIVLKLVRNDYVIDDLPLFTPTSGLLKIEEDDSSSQDEIFNELIGTGRDPITNEDFQVRVHNLAARVSQGAPNAQEKEYPGIPTRDLMVRVLQRDLRESACGLKKFTLILDRAGWKLRPGMVFRIQDTRRGINNMVLRVAEVEDRSFKDGRVTVKAMQDVWGMPASSWVKPVESTWTPPPTEALPAAAEQIVEANYRDIVLKQDASVAQALDPTDSLMGVVALSPNPAMYTFDLASRASGEAEFDTDTTGSFTGCAQLTADITPLQTTFVVAAESSFDDSNVGQALLCGDEQMAFVDYDAATHTVTVARGVGDTIPQAHLAGAFLWTIDDDLVGDRRKYVSGETVEAKVLTRTSSDLLDEAEADLMSLVMQGRQARPYPPGNVTVDGTLALTPLPSNSTGHEEPLIEWAHRDRILQEDQLVGHTDASVGPEAGTTYNIRIYDHNDPATVLREVTGLAGTSWTYDATMQAADGNPVAVYVELESERDGLTSYQTYRFLVWIQSGYGYGYGLNYGGA